jgi:hypothetical protein
MRGVYVNVCHMHMEAPMLPASTPAAAPWPTLPFAAKPWPIAATVLAFILWWPLGLLALFLLWKGVPSMGHLFACRGTRRDRDSRRRWRFDAGGSGNSAFDEYRDATLRRLEEERRALDEQQRAFGEFVQQLRRAKDREEFDRFMAGRAGTRGDMA